MSTPEPLVIPGWLHVVLRLDRSGSSWYVGTGFFFAPVLAVLSPWPELTVLLWALIGLAGLWLGLLGIAMATGLAIVLRSGQEIPEDYWRRIVDYPTSVGGWDSGQRAGGYPRRLPECRADDSRLVIGCRPG